MRDCVFCGMQARHEEWIVEGKSCGETVILELAEIIQTWDDGVIWCGMLTVGTMKGSWVGIYFGNRIIHLIFACGYRAWISTQKIETGW